jgi:hypothetical protein
MSRDPAPAWTRGHEADHGEDHAIVSQDNPAIVRPRLTHFIPHALEHGFTEFQASSALGLMWVARGSNGRATSMGWVWAGR